MAKKGSKRIIPKPQREAKEIANPKKTKDLATPKKSNQ